MTLGKTRFLLIGCMDISFLKTDRRVFVSGSCNFKPRDDLIRCPSIWRHKIFLDILTRTIQSGFAVATRALKHGVVNLVLLKLFQSGDD